MSGSHCTPHRGATIRLKHKKTDEAQKAETVLSAVIYIYITNAVIYMYITALMRPRRPKQYCLQLDIALWCKNQIEHSI